MKICVIVIMALYSTITSASKPHPENLYERWHGKCTNVKDIQRHPSQLTTQFKSCFSVDSSKLYTTSCYKNRFDGRDRQFFQMKSSSCKI